MIQKANNVSWKLKRDILLAVSIISAVLLGSRSYPIEETLLLLLAFSGLGILVLFFLIALLLLQEGARRAVLWLTAKTLGFCGFRDHHLSSTTGVGHPQQPSEPL